MSSPISLKLSVIRTDAGTQSRAGINEEVVSDYAERMLEGDKFPAVVVFHDGTDYFLADGFHRVLSCARCEFVDVLADVRTGTRLDAVKYSLSANISNGLHRSIKDKRHSIQIGLKEFPTLSNRAIAQLCGVSDMMVAANRTHLAGQVQESCTSKRTGADGKEYPATKTIPVSAPAVEPKSEPVAIDTTDLKQAEEEREMIVDGAKKEAARVAFRGVLTPLQLFKQNLNTICEEYLAEVKEIPEVRAFITEVDVMKRKGIAKQKHLEAQKLSTPV